jgi:hypothetical protein
MRYTTLAAALVASLVFPAGTAGQGSADEARDSFFDAIEDCNARRVLELLSDDSGDEARQAVDSLRSVLADMDPVALGEFFSGFGMIVAPDEVQYWEEADFLEILLVSSGFDTTWAEAEESEEGAWRIDVKNGVFHRMLRDLDLEPYTAP